MRSKILVNCAFCDKKFLKSLHHVKENIRLNHRFFCSITCQSKFKNKRVSLKCENFKCGKGFLRQRNDTSHHNFCSRSCAATINNHKFHRQHSLFKKCANLHCHKIFIGERKYCNKSCRPPPKSYSQQEILQKIQYLAEKLGRTPTRRESTLSDSCRKYFGSWNNTVIAAGLVPYHSKSQRMFKRIQTYSKDGHYCYSISEVLIDNWLTNHCVQHQKEIIYPEGKFIVDWSLPNRKTFIEYFGLTKDVSSYDLTIKKKRKICQKYGINLIELYPRDLYPLRNYETKLAKYLTSYSPRFNLKLWRRKNLRSLFVPKASVNS